MIRLVLVNPRVWTVGEELRVKVCAVSQIGPGVWKLVLEELKDKSKSPPLNNPPLRE